jgi:hypothetical protein
LKSDKNKHKKKIGNQVRKPIKIININFQSICNKKPDLLEIINSVKPYIIIGTETWLDKSIPSTDYFPNNMYNIYRNDRAPNTKDKSHGGVLLAITKDFISSEITELKTNCEIVWAEINITGTKQICVARYYRRIFFLCSFLSGFNFVSLFGDDVAFGNQGCSIQSSC